jgi:2-polyprenyl-3-methyl-5-hydroxy-6-metoxy-1,4-benzoquinol methylase
VATTAVETCLGDPRAGFETVATGYDFEYRTCANEFEIRRSVDSGVCYVFPQPSTESLNVIYPPDYGPFQFQHARGLSRWARDFVQRGKAQTILALAGPGGKILDVGTGSGMLVRQLVQQGAARENVYANDFTAEVLAPLAKEGFRTIVGLAETIDVEERFHVICLNQVLEHLPNPVQAVARLASLLVPGGCLFIETPSTDGRDCRLFQRGYWGGYHIPRHFFIFNESSLRRLAADTGLEVAEVKYLASPAFWIQCCHHALFDHGWFGLARFFTIKNPLVLALATAHDLLTVAAGGRTSNIRIIARRPR